MTNSQKVERQNKTATSSKLQNIGTSIKANKKGRNKKIQFLKRHTEQDTTMYV
jgi:hypothetical protein